VKYPLTSNNSDRDSYQIDLIKFLLDKAHVTYELQSTHEIYTQARIVRELKEGKRINIYWMGTSPQLEEELLTLRYPIYRGLLGHRVFIIHKQDQRIFDNIRTLGQLQKFKGAQGIGWSDVAILEGSGLEQHTTKYENIFKMINRGGRVSYFSRGLNEGFSEVEHRKETLQNLTVEKNITLVYPFAMFLFVSPNDETLKNYLEKGFQLAYEDGSFIEFFYNHPKIKQSIDTANLEKRIRIEIPNPFLTPKTAQIKSDYWHGKFTR
jgi:hypothetical protein